MLQKQEKVPYPICPLTLYFEGDETICDGDKCDYNCEFRECTEACSKDKMMEAERIRNDEEWEFTLRLYEILYNDIGPVMDSHGLNFITEKELFDMIQEAKVK